MKRFYRSADIAPLGDRLYTVTLDGKPLRTPKGKGLKLPRALAEAVAAEWNAQGDELDPAPMRLTRCINTAIDRIEGYEEIAIFELLGHADLLCHRADKPELAARQAEAWNPLLDWLGECLGARLKTGVGVAYIAQDEDAVSALRQALRRLNVFQLTAVDGAAAITGSLALALALAEGRLNAEQALALSQVDETFQAERWGRGEDAVTRTRRLALDLAALETVLTSCR